MMKIKTWLLRKDWFDTQNWQVLMIAITALVFPLSLIIEEDSVNTFKKNTRATLGFTESISFSGQSGRYIHYYYKVNGEVFHDTKSSWDQNIQVPNGKVLVFFDTLNPQISAAFLYEDLSEYSELGTDLDSSFRHKREEIDSWNWK